MRKFLIITLVSFSLIASQKLFAQNTKQSNVAFANMLEQYFKERMQLLPIGSTAFGEQDNNDKLYADFTDSYRDKLRDISAVI